MFVLTLLLCRTPTRYTAVLNYIIIRAGHFPRLWPHSLHQPKRWN